jgi:multidrug transporter EmrE-like cation transporter
MILFCRGFQTPTNYEVVRRQVAGRVIVIPTGGGISYCCAFASPVGLRTIRDVSTPLDMTNDMRNKPLRGRPSGFGNPWLQLALSVLCVFVSELLLKRGATDVAEPDSAFSWTGINGLASPLVWWAILLIIASFISWLYVLRYIPITIAFPLSRVVDILVPLGCWIFLRELISPLRWCGIALVVIGLALVAKPVAQIEERL